jgi:hypothetical protein
MVSKTIILLLDGEPTHAPGPGICTEEQIMHTNRFREQTGEWSFGAIPSAKAPASGFMVCPVALQRPAGVVCMWQQHLYQWAFERAQAAAHSSLLERAMKVVWN